MSFLVTPRPYQVEAKEAILSRKESGVTRQLVSLPTGTGKTVLFGLLAKELNTKTLIIAHREQLIKQAVDKVSLVWPGVDIGVCMADRNEIESQIVVASIQTASKPGRLEQLKEKGFSLCVVDEAHHAASPSYKTLLKELGFLNEDPGKLLVGVTATPKRKGGGLGDIFQEVVFERSIGTMIKAGYLSDLKGKRILTSTSLNGVSVSNGDFADNQLAEICNTPERNALIVSSFLEHSPERKGIAFTCDVQHSLDLAEAFKRDGIPASAIYGTMSDQDKDSIMDRFSNGELQVLTNCALLTEGFDQPDISAVLMCRPTRSQPLYVQCVGRGTRLHPGKADCLVLDFCDNYHSVQSIATLDKTVCLTADEGSETKEGKGAPQKEKPVHTVFVGEQFIGDFELLDRSRFAWVPVKDHWHLQLSPSTSLWLKKEGGGYIPELQEGDSFKELVSRSIPLDYAMGLAEDWVRRNKDYERWSSRDAHWRSEPPSEKQAELLLKMGYDPSCVTKGEANQIIGQRINEQNLWKYEPATAKQRYILTVNGFKVPADLKKGEASSLIKELQNYGKRHAHAS